MTAAISFPPSCRISSAWGHSKASSWLKCCNAETKGLIRRSASWTAGIQEGGRANAWLAWGMFVKNLSYRSQQMAELVWVGRMQWYTRPWIAMKPGGPAILGKAWVVSRDANEKIRLSTLESAEMSGCKVRASIRGGRGGNGATSLKRELFRPQQKPASSPVSRIRPHVGHAWMRPAHCSPQRRDGDDIGLMFHVLEGDVAIRSKDESAHKRKTWCSVSEDVACMLDRRHIVVQLLTVEHHIVKMRMIRRCYYSIHWCTRHYCFLVLRLPVLLPGATVTSLRTTSPSVAEKQCIFPWCTDIDATVSCEDEGSTPFEGPDVGGNTKVLSCWGAVETKLHNKRCEHIEVSDGEEKTYLVDEVVSEGIGELDTTFEDGDNCALLEAKLMRHYTVWKTYGDIQRGCNCSKFSFFGCGC